VIAIIDYGMGNLRSVANAFRAVGGDPRITADAKDLSKASAIVLPGVGAFAEGMRRLHAAGFVDALNREVRENGRPFIGLCLGMQLIATDGEEHGMHAGLGWIKGTVRRILPDASGAKLRIPHVGWNDLEVVHRRGLLEGAAPAPTFYFVHSFIFVPEDPSVVSGYTEYGERFATTVEHENIYGTQFHPEKSQRDGLALLGRFVEISKKAC
jgi:imidazole glycerol-phosphate synthase subunit HisH